MGLAFKAAGANFSKVISSLTLPDRTGLVGEYHFGTSNALSIVNHANASLPMSATGTPVHSTYYTTIKSGGVYGNHGFDVGQAPPANDLTLICLIRKLNNFPGVLYQQNGAPTGFYNYTDVPALYNARLGDLSEAANLTVPAHSNFFMMAGRAAIGGACNLHIWTGGVRADNTGETNGQVPRTAGNLFIGSQYGFSGSGQMDIAYAAIFERVLTTTELDDIYTALDTFFTNERGLTVS